MSVFIINNFVDTTEIHTAHDDDLEDDLNNFIILIFLFVEHIIFYFVEIYRKREIKLYGKPDVNGIYRAPIESFFRNVEIFVDCILFGWIIKYLIMMDQEYRHKDAYFTYWMVTDCSIMFTKKFYCYLSEKLCIKNEINKNISTLSFV